MYWKSLLMCVLGRESGISSWVLFLLGLPASWKHFICSERSEARRLRLTPSIWHGTEEQISLFWFGRGYDCLISRLDHIQGRLGLSSISQNLSDLRRWTILLSKAFFIFFCCSHITPASQKQWHELLLLGELKLFQKSRDARFDACLLRMSSGHTNLKQREVILWLTLAVASCKLPDTSASFKCVAICLFLCCLLFMLILACILWHLSGCLLNRMHVGFTATNWISFNLMLCDCDPKKATQNPTGLFNVIAFYGRNKDFVSK